MLILSRRPSETIRFPQLGISVSIVSVRGSRVQVGIDAPPEIQVLRRELEGDQASGSGSGVNALPPVSARSALGPKSDRTQHDFRNRLNKATLGIHLAQKQMMAGKHELAEQTLAAALASLAELDAIQGSTNEASTDRVSSTSDLADERSSTDRRRSQSAAIDILLVEDDPNERALLQGLLELEGYRVQTACNGNEALRCLSHFTPKFVLLDMMMPECDGRDTLHQIRQMPAFAHLPIFAVSGSSPDSVGLSIGDGGVEQWFPKPLNAPRLMQHMRDRVASLST